MKRLLSLLLTAVLIFAPLCTCFASDSDDYFSDREVFLAEIRTIFPEKWDDISAVLANNKTDSRTVEYIFSKSESGNDYELTIYADDTIELLIGYAPVCISQTRANYSKWYQYSQNITGLQTGILNLRVDYTYTGQNTAPSIYDCYATGNYVTVIDYDVNYYGTLAYAEGNAYYIDEDAWPQVFNIYYTGMYISASSDTGHNFTITKYLNPLY
ncbi:MAG: hypothetical protein IIZ17_01610 [Eubacteriaceae bacterium]|nr:hypothetical protein [Eubacteriaceae bacterium]